MLTFDTYGGLTYRESGSCNAHGPLLGRLLTKPGRHEVLELFPECEKRQLAETTFS